MPALTAPYRRKKSRIVSLAHRIVCSKRAVQDLDSIADYIAADSPAYAGVVIKNIVNQTRILRAFRRRAAKCLNLTMKTYANLSSTATGLFIGWNRTRR